MKPLLAFLALIVALLVPVRPALAQESCDPNDDPIEQLICKIDSLTATVDSLQLDLDEIAANVSPEWTWQGLWCVGVDALRFDAQVGGGFSAAETVEGHLGVDAYGNGATASVEASLGGGIDIGLGAGVGIGGTWCFNTPPQIIEGPELPQSAGKGFMAAGGYDMQQILDQSQAMQDGFAQVWGDFAEAVGNPTNLSITAQSVINGFSVSQDPSDMMSDFSSLASQVTDLLPLPSGLKTTMSDPASLVSSTMDVDQLCAVVSTLPESDAWAKTLEYCADGYPIEDPEAFVQDFNELLNQEIDSDWLTSDFRDEWNNMVSSLDGVQTTLDTEFDPSKGGSLHWKISDIGSRVGDIRSVLDYQFSSRSGALRWQIDRNLNTDVAGIRSAIDRANSQLNMDMKQLCRHIGPCDPPGPYRDWNRGGEEEWGANLSQKNGLDNAITEKLGVQAEFDVRDHFVPDDYFMEGAYPNPSQSHVTLQYGLPQAETVQIRVFDTAGREVLSALHRPMPAGRHSLDLDVSNLASGTYFYRIDAGPWVSSKTITVNN